MLARLAVVAFATPALAFQSAPLQWDQNPANLHWYGVPFGAGTWASGEALAVAQAGHLATIRSAAENAWISTTFVGVNPSGIWIGLNDQNVEGQYVWVSGEASTYTNWQSGEPNNIGNQDVARLVPTASWRWDDIAESTSNLTPLVESVGAPGTGWTLPRGFPVQNTPMNLDVADLSGDGVPDVVVPSSNTFTVLVSDGGGGFHAPSSTATASGPTTVVARDLDNDGDVDIALACGSSTRLRVHWNDGANGFAAFTEHVYVGQASGLAAGDFDGDGLLDLAVTTVQTQDRLWIHRNLGGGVFGAPIAYAAGQRPHAVTAGDLDGDMDVDLLVSNFDSDDLGIYRNQGDGLFVSSALIPRGNGPCRGEIADFSHDGLPDFAVPCRLDGSLRVFFGTGAGQFVPAVALPTVTEPTYCRLGNFDGDAFLDVAVSNFIDDAVGIYRGRADGYLDLPYFLRAGDGPIALATYDAIVDGRDEIVVSNQLGNRISVLRNISRDCNGNGVDDPVDIQLGTSADCNANGEPDECDLSRPATFDCDANGMVDSCEIVADASLDLDVDGTLDECEVAGTPYCFGDGSGATCPCDPGQAGDPQSGCRNSFGTSGRLVAVGNPSVANDSVSLRGTGLLVNTTVGLFFQGTGQQNGGLGSPFGDGLLCVTGTVVRLEIRSASGGAMAFGRDVPGDPELSVDGAVPPAGATRYYQIWYRDPPMFCTTSTFNLTNGVRIVWTL